MAGLLGDQSDSSGNSGGFLQGLLSLFKPDYSAEYTGSLAKDPTTGQMDPAVQRAFAMRALAGASQAFAEGGMPVPYKGGIPLLSTIGKAGAAATLAPDSLIDAREKAAQTTLALANAGNAQAMALARQGFAQGYQQRPTGGQSDTGTGTDGKPKTGPAALLASQSGAAGGISPTDHYSFLLNNGASKNEATMLTSAANSESSFRADLTHDGGIGYGLYGHNDTRLAAMRTFAGVGPNDPVPWQQQALYALAELRGQVPGLPGGGEPKAGAMVNAATNPEQLTEAQLAFERPNLNIAGGNRAQRLASTTEYWNKPPYAEQPPTQTASAGPAPASGAQVGPYAPVPGQPPPQGVYVPPGGTKPLDIQTGQPAAPSAAAPLPAPMATAPPGGPPANGALPPGAEGNPGPVSLLGPQPQQVAAADGPALNPAAAAIEQGRRIVQGGGGLLGSGTVAGPGAPSEPPAPAPADAAAARAAVMGQEGGGVPGLLQQPPPPAVAPAPAPGSAAPPPAVPAPAAPQAAPAAPVAPAALPPPPAMPPELNKHISDAEIQWAKKMSALAIAGGLTVPPDIAALSTLDVDMAKQEQQARLKAYYDNQNELYKTQLGIAAAGPTAAQKAPYTATRPGGSFPIFGPDGKTVTGWQQAPSPPTVQPGPPNAAGQPTQQYAYPPTTPGGPVVVSPIPGPAGLSPQQKAYGTGVGGAQAGQQPLPAPQQPAPPPGAPPRPVYQGTPLAPGMTSKEPDYQEPQYNETQLKAGYAADNWPKTTRELTASLGPAQQAEQRLTNIASAFQQVGTRAFTTNRADWNNALDGIFGVGGGPEWLRTATDAGAVMTALHDTQRATLSNLKATNPRFANAEFQSLSKMSENPDLPISANVNMLAEDIGQLRQQQALAQGWIAARADGKQDPDLFQAMWFKQNPLAPIVDGVKKEISIGQLAPPPPPTQGGHPPNGYIFDPRTNRIVPK